MTSRAYGRNEGGEAPVLRIEHKPRYLAALQAYRQARGMEPDAHWKALLYLTTSIPSLWGRVRPRLDYEHGNAHLDGIEGLSGGEGRILDLARNLYNENQVHTVNMGDLVDALDDERWAAVLEALRIRRGEAGTGDEHLPS